jgi:hypothetical protein
VINCGVIKKKSYQLFHSKIAGCYAAKKEKRWMVAYRWKEIVFDITRNSNSTAVKGNELIIPCRGFVA